MLSVKRGMWGTLYGTLGDYKSWLLASEARCKLTREVGAVRALIFLDLHAGTTLEVQD